MSSVRKQSACASARVLFLAVLGLCVVVSVLVLVLWRESAARRSALQTLRDHAWMTTCDPDCAPWLPAIIEQHYHRWFPCIVGIRESAAVGDPLGGASTYAYRPITDAERRAIRTLHGLRRLDFGSLVIEDRDLVVLETHQSLEELVICNGRVTDRGTEALARLDQLKVLILDRSPISSEGLADLRSLRQLQVLSVAGISAEDGDVRALLAQWPQLEIVKLPSGATVSGDMGSMRRGPILNE